MSLDFRKVETGTTLNFAKDFGSAVSGTVTFNLNWGMLNGQAVDLDAFLVMEHRGPSVTAIPKKKSLWTRIKEFFGLKINNSIDLARTPFLTKTIYFGKKYTTGVFHHGDDLTGADADGEFIEVNLNNIHPAVDTLTFSVLSFSGHSFGSLPFADIRVFEGEPSKPKRGLVEHKLTKFKSSTKTVVLAQLKRNAEGEWNITALDNEYRSNSVSGVTTICKGV